MGVVTKKIEPCKKFLLGYFVAVTTVPMPQSQENVFRESIDLPPIREFLVLQWILFSFCLTVSYKSVLLATLVSIEYEKPIDTVADMLNSDKEIVGPAATTLPMQLKHDPRESVRRLSSRIKFVPFNGTIPAWIQEG